MVLRGRRRARPPADAATACHAAAVSKVYGSRDTAVHALRGVTLSIPRGAFTAIMGPSGSGKSTLLHCLAALDTPTSGRVFLGGTELTALSRRQQAQVRRDRIGFVFQSFNLVPTLDALENITLPQLLAGRRPDRAWLHHMIARVGLGDRLHHRPSELSGGQQQRIALARALAGRPEVIFADEPTGNLDTTASHEMLTLLRDAVDQFEQTVVTVTHDPSIASYADQILYFSDGRVTDGTDRPDADHESDRPQQEHSVESVNGRHDRIFPARRRADGQQTMRSRRRRQPDEPAPGRPMVGSDDEVEVARQERWLQRIREQFDSEYEALDDTDPDAPTEGHPPARHDTIQQPTHRTHDDAHPAGHDHRAGPHDGTHGDTGDATHPYDERPPATDHAAGNRDERPPATDHARAPFHHPAADTDGWLPPEQAQLYSAPVTDTPAGHGADTSPDRWREDTVTRSEIAPWSRPADDTVQEQEIPQPTDTSGWRVTGDPWAPPDEHRAEEYHSERSTSRRTPNWQHDSGDVWSTGRWQTRADDAAADERVDDERVDDERRDADRFDATARHDTDAHPRAAAPVPGGMDRPAWQVDAGEEARFARWRREDDPIDDEGGAAPNGSYRNGRHADDPPPAANGHRRDPWTGVWETPTAPDIGEVWTPTFDHSWHSNGNGRAGQDAQDVEPSHGDDAGEHPSDGFGAGDAPWSAPVDDAAPALDEADPILGERARWWADDGPSAIDAPHGDATVHGAETRDDDHVTAAHEGTGHIADAPPSPPSVADEGAAAQPERMDAADAGVAPPSEPVTCDVPASARAPQVAADAAGTSDDGADDALAAPAPDSQRRAAAPVTRTRPERTAAASTHHTDPEVPPPLASLRNTRRPEEWVDPMEALQSLQAQLDRLGGTGRRNRRPRRTGSGDTDRPER